MTDTEPLLQALKKTLRSRGLTYAELARRMGVSEPTVKRWFSQGGMSLRQFTEVLKHCGASYADLAKLMDAQSEADEHEYTLEQEQLFVQSPRTHAFFNLLLQYGGAAQVRRRTGLSLAAMNRHLSALERIGLIERLPKDKIRFLVSKKVAWRKDGPLRRQFLSEAKQEFLGSTFAERSALFRFLHLQLTQRSASEFIEHLTRKAAELHHVSEVEKTIDPELESFGVLLAVRPWTFSKLTLLSDEGPSVPSRPTRG